MMGSPPEDVGSRVQVPELMGAVSTSMGMFVIAIELETVLARITPGRYEVMAME